MPACSMGRSYSTALHCQLLDGTVPKQLRLFIYSAVFTLQLAYCLYLCCLLVRA